MMEELVIMTEDNRLLFSFWDKYLLVHIGLASVLDIKISRYHLNFFTSLKPIII